MYRPRLSFPSDPLQARRVLLGDVSSRYADLVESVFSSAIAGKAWLATGAVVLAIVQVLTASRMWGKLQGVVPVSFATSRRIHRWSGRVALLLTLPVFFHCVTILGFRTPDARIAIHSIAGSFVYGVVAAKLLVIWRKGYQHWVLPVLGGSLATILATLWLTSSFWYFTSVRFGFLMARRFAPLLVLVAVSLAVFGLAKWHPFSPTVPAAVTAPPARNAVRGAAIFATSCAGCHGAEATGGVGPALRGSGLTAAEVAAVVASGRGVMPAGIVTGQDAADVAAHVASIAK